MVYKSHSVSFCLKKKWVRSGFDIKGKNDSGQSYTQHVHFMFSVDSGRAVLTNIIWIWFITITSFNDFSL